MIEYIFVDVLAFAHIQSRSLFRGEGVLVYRWRVCELDLVQES